MLSPRSRSLFAPRRAVYAPRRQHDHGDRNLNHEFEHLLSRIVLLEAKLRKSGRGAKTIVNSSGSPIPAGSLLGWTTAGVLALADAGDGTASGTKIRPLMVSPEYLVGINERFTPHGTGELALVRVDGTGTYTVGKRLVCSATAGKASVTAPASPDKLFTVGWISDELDTATSLVPARLELGVGTTT